MKVESMLTNLSAWAVIVYVTGTHQVLSTGMSQFHSRAACAVVRQAVQEAADGIKRGKYEAKCEPTGHTNIEIVPGDHGEPPLR